MRSSRETVAALVLGALALGVAALAATSSLGPVVTARPGPPPSRPLPTVSAPAVTPGPAESLPPWAEEPGPLSAWIGQVLAIAGVAAGMVLLALLLVAVARRVRQEKPLQAATAVAGEAQVLDEDVLTEVAESLDEALQRLSVGADVDAAILACWYRLERAAEASGVPRRPSQTTEEFTVSVLAATPVDSADLRALADLYRRAMFSGVPATEQDRGRARGCLERLVGALQGSWA